MTRTEHSRTGHIVGAAVILLAVMASACNELPAEPIRVDNTSNQGVEIRGVWEDGSPDPGFGWIDAGTTATLTHDGCIEMDLEARLWRRTVVAGRPAPFCQGDVWVITQAQVDAATSE